MQEQILWMEIKEYNYSQQNFYPEYSEE